MGETEDIRASLERRRFRPHTMRALLRVLEGEPYRVAARAERIDPATLHRAAGTVPGLRRAHLEALRERFGGELPPVYAHHARALDEAA